MLNKNQYLKWKINFDSFQFFYVKIHNIRFSGLTFLAEKGKI